MVATGNIGGVQGEKLNVLKRRALRYLPVYGAYIRKWVGQPDVDFEVPD